MQTTSAMPFPRDAVGGRVVGKFGKGEPTPVVRVQFASPGGLVHRRREENGPEKNCEGDVEHDRDSARSLEHRYDGPLGAMGDATTAEASISCGNSAPVRLSYPA